MQSQFQLNEAAVKLTPVQKRVLKRLSERQSVSGSPEVHVAWRLEARGLIENGRCSVSYDKIFTYYDLTDAGRSALGTQ